MSSKEKVKELLRACSDGDIDAVNRLLKDGVDHSALNNRAIKMASGNGHAEVVELLLEDGVDPSAKSDAIVRASYGGHVKVVELLLEAGADPSANESDAIIYASSNGHVKVVERLLEAGADGSARNNTAIVEAITNGHWEVVKILLSDPRVDAFPLLMDAVKKNLAGEKIDILIKNRDLVPRILEQFNANPVNRNYPDVQKKLEEYKQRSRTKTCKMAEDVVEMSEYDIMDYLNVTLDDDKELSDEKKEVERKKRIIFFLGERIEDLRPYTTTLNFLLYSLHNSLYSTDCKYDGSLYSDMKDAIFLLKVGPTPHPVYLTNLIQALRTNKKVFVVLPLFDEKGERINVDRTAGIAQLGNSTLLGIDPNNIDYFSADHCQAGTDKKLYGVYACEGEDGNPLYPVCHRDA
jgi:Ankyrin repeats (3 copies)